ncbi:hypothetical protein HNP87_001577 [Methanococcus maripaludis]|uniref:Formylmethanofuran dehydrogenase subunit B n=1 Tax=Methanococcus maripaludis TaxID=39152 RepID=A0A7J9NJC7_METMI|nr:hypothetical protein [Methanococcus maripaludis]
MVAETFKDIVCPVCGSTCDDIEVEYDKEKKILLLETPVKWALLNLRKL